MQPDLWTVEDHLRDKPPVSIALYLRFVKLVATCGPFTIAVAKTSITFKGTRRGFAGARPTNRGLAAYLDLVRQVTDPRIIRSSPYTKRLFTHQVRLTRLEELDDGFAALIREAYAVGAGAHLADPIGTDRGQAAARAKRQRVAPFGPRS